MQTQILFILLAMDSFRVYLPSNASMDVFPHNKPSDFKVQMNPPLQLDGKWEVGVENVCYHSAIADLNDIEKITLRPRGYRYKSMNEVFDFPYVLTSDGKWNYDWIQLEYKPKHKLITPMQNINQSLNTGNALILKDKNQKVYSFDTSYWRFKPYHLFTSYSSGFAMRIDRTLHKHMGFGYSGHVFDSGRGNVKRINSKLTKTNFQIRIF